MADFYPYLIASLPMLHFGMKPPLSFERLIEVCLPFMPEKDFQVLRSLPGPEQYSEKEKYHRIVQKWIEFDGALRNELVRIRATQKQIEPVTYLRPNLENSSSFNPALMAVNMATTMIDTEKTLDETRWKALEDLASGHFFDLYFLITYALKLLILLRWENIRRADGTILLEHVLQPETGIHEST